MRTCLLLLLLASLSCLAVYAQETITFFVTYRDFLPATCMIDTISSEAFDEYNSSWGGATPGGLGDGGSNAQCDLLTAAWLNRLADGTISGHPDFEPATTDYVNQDQCENEVLPAKSCIFAKDGEGTEASLDASPLQSPTPVRAVVSLNISYASSGIPKPQYCSENPGSRCGANTGQTGPSTKYTTSRKALFDYWFNDNRKYNKRIGQRLTLRSQVNGTFVFDSEVDTENLEFAGFGTDPNTDVADFFDPLYRFKNDNTGFTIDPSVITDPSLAKAWPQTWSVDKRSFSFTTEIHTTFQYRKDADMRFEFSGDDDFWCFINNRLAIDLGGLHESRNAEIDLNDDTDVRGFSIAETLDLEDGEIYTIDIYHAERHSTQSNFKITTSLFEKCNVGQSGTAFLNSSNPEDIGEKLSLSNQAEYDHDTQTLRLLKKGKAFANSYAYTTEQQNVGPGFISKFTVTIDGTPEGFAFVVQRFGLTNYPFSGGKHLNFKNLPNSFAVAFDLCSDRINGTCNVQSVTLHYPPTAGEPNKVSPSTTTVYDEIFRPLNLKLDGTPESIEILIRFLETPDHLEIYIDNSLYLRKTDFSIASILGGNAANIGLTAVAGGPSQTADINVTDWEIDLVQFDANKTLAVGFENFTQQVTVADGSQSEGAIILTRDFCENQLDSGGLKSFISAKYVEEQNVTTGLYFNDSSTPVVEEAVVVDNGDGSYSLALSTLVPGEFSLYLSFGNDCNLIVIGESVSFLGSNDECFFASIDRATLVVEPEVTSPPTVDPSTLGGDRTLVLALGIGGGLIGAAALVAGVLFARYRNQWLQNKGYIEQGRIHRWDEGTDYNTDKTLTETGTRLMATRVAILRERAKMAQDPKTKELVDAQNTNDLLKEQIRLQAMKAQKKEAVDVTTQAVAKRKIDKKEFEQDDDV